MYALIAMGLTLQYGVARIMNLSYGEFLIAAAFAALLPVHRRWPSARCSALLVGGAGRLRAQLG